MATSTGRGIPEAAYQLGGLRKDFRISAVQLALCAGMLAFLVGFSGWMGFAAFSGALAPQNGTDAAMLIGIVAALIGAPLLGAGWGIRKLLKTRNSRVLLFEEGFVSIRHDQVFVCRWDEVASVFDGIIFASDAYVRWCTVYKRSGEEWTIRNDRELVHGFPQLVRALNDETNRRLVPQMLAELEAGHSLDFGAVTLTPEGIAYDNRLLPWSELKRVDCEDMRVGIEQRGAWLTWAAISNGSIPNRFALQEVANAFKQKAVAMTLLV
jgi:hypothetical protein